MFFDEVVRAANVLARPRSRLDVAFDGEEKEKVGCDGDKLEEESEL